MTPPIRMVSVPVALPLKLIDTLKPLAVVAEKLKHCHVVEVCEPTPDNPSRNIIPMPREWFERTADDLEAIAVLMHGAGVLSEGQASTLTGLDRVEVRKQVDALTAAPVREEGGAVEAVGANAGSVNGRLVHAIDLIAKGLYLARGGTEDAYKVEGGEGPSVYGAGKVHRRINEVRGEAYRVVMAWRKSDPFSSKPALPTREAPAEAGAALGRLSALLSASHLAGDAAVAGLGAVSWNDLRAVLDAALRAQPEEAQPVGYGADHQPWCQPGDQTQRAFRLRFEDPDMREMVWTGPDAEREALAAYNQYAPAWNVYLFSGHPRTPPTQPLTEGADAEKLRVAVEAEQLGTALADLVSWFTNPVQGERGLVWVIPAGQQGADDAVAQALAALQREGVK